MLEKGESVRSLFKATGVVAVVAAAVLTFVPVAAANPSRVLASDACSPSFNVLFDDPTICNRNGGTPVDVFLQQLGQNKFAGAWHFSPPHVTVDAGDSLTVENRGGETHTFSEVSQFGGGGIVPPLNEILFGTPNPPTFFLPNPPGQPTNFIPAGGEITIGPSTLTPGTHLFMCAIHPWMEDTVVVR
jgi:plastocyanin